MDNQAIIAIIVFLLSYALIISEKIHRTIIAISGAVLMIGLGILNQNTAIHHIDFNTLGLLIGMMILVYVTSETGAFHYVAIWAAKKVKGDPLKILVVFALITAVASAFLDNVTTVLLMVPITFTITRQLKVNPFPYLITEILASNIGGTATMIGDPPNIMIGSAVKELTFGSFINNLALICGIILLVTLPILAFIYRKQLNTTKELRKRLMELNEKEAITDKKLLIKSLSVLTLTIIGLFLGHFLHMDSATIALAGAFLLLLLSGEHHLERALENVEWTTIFFFVGLFVLVGGLVETGVIETLATEAIVFTEGDLTKTSMLILWMSAIASSFVDNIPFVATMIPLIQEMGELGITYLDPLWWSLALGACLGGNGTLIGASANLIVAGLAEKEGEHISFVKFMLIGFPIMILSVLISSIYIYLRYLI